MTYLTNVLLAWVIVFTIGVVGALFGVVYGTLELIILLLVWGLILWLLERRRKSGEATD